MLTPKQLADFIIKTWSEQYPDKPGLLPRESTIVYLAEELLKSHVVVPKDNWQTLESYHQWMRSVDDKLGIMCLVLNSLDVKRHEIKPDGKGRRKKIVMRVEDDDSDGSDSSDSSDVASGGSGGRRNSDEQ